jgi:plastocyanin
MKAGNENREDRGFTQLAAMVAVLLSMASLLAVAFKLNDNQQAARQVTVASASATVPPEHVKLTIKSDEEHGRQGPDGSWHDAFIPANLSIKAGATVTVTVLNYDESPHTFTSPELGTNEEISPGSETKPSETTFTFHAPAKAGSYEWFCALPCDPWAMNEDGFMRGHVTVT